jgi:hypothetical protein
MMLRFMGIREMLSLLEEIVGVRYVAAAIVGSAVVGAVASGSHGGGGSTTVVSQPPAMTPEMQEQQRLQLAEMQRQNTIAAALLPGQQANIQLQNQLIQYQLDHAGDLDSLHQQQLALAVAQLHNQQTQEAMTEQLQPLQLQAMRDQSALYQQQIHALGIQTDQQTQANQYILAGLRSNADRMAAYDRLYTPEQQAQDAATQAQRTTRMSALSEEAANIQLENLRRGTKPTDEQLADINEAYDASQQMGEQNISHYLTQTLRQINEETSQASGLRPTDTPVVRLSERAGEAAAMQQGQLTSSIAQGRATARLNYPLAASQLAGQQASTLESLTAGSTNYQDSLAANAAANRNQAFGAAPGVGFAMPQGTPAQNLGFMTPQPIGNNPNAFNVNLYNPNAGTQTTTPPWYAGLQGFGQLATGLGNAYAAYTQSDRRLKDNVRRVGKTPAGLPTYTFTYKGDSTPHFGVMAQEVAKKFPKAVVRDPVTGFLGVNYAAVH